jgi:hypothetical protein
MNANFDPYREYLVVETDTVWPAELADVAEPQRKRVEDQLHANPQEAAQLDYVRLPSGFCRRITVTPEDLKR